MSRTPRPAAARRTIARKGGPSRRSPVGADPERSPSSLDLVVDSLAAYRLTRLATIDVVGEPARQAILRRVGIAEPVADGTAHPNAEAMVDADPAPPKLATLVTCRWCAGIWVAVGVGAARRWAPRAWSPVAWGLALSAGAALLARLEEG
ncbi:MAG TPA: DUF1360 domain-containing protein [Iamia sp.]|nr:DUF1360 domain-containing protein [Iamia sp.]